LKHLGFCVIGPEETKNIGDEKSRFNPWHSLEQIRCPLGEGKQVKNARVIPLPV